MGNVRENSSGAQRASLETQFPLDTYAISRDELQNVLDFIPQLVCVVGPDRKRLYANRVLLNYFGFTVDVWRSCPGTEVHPDDSIEFKTARDRAVSDGLAFETEARLRRHDGAYRWHLVRYNPVHDDEGKLLRWYIACTDIDSRKQSEFYLLEAQRLARIGSWAFSAGGFEYWSSQLFTIHGLQPSTNAPTISEYLALVHPDDRDFVAETIHKMSSEASAFDFSKRILGPDGVVRHIRCVGIPTYDGRFMGTGIDITEQEELAVQLRRSKAHLTNAQALSHTGSVGMEVRTKQIFWSDEAARIYGYPAGTEPTPELILQRSHPDDLQILIDALTRAGSGGADFDFEHRLLMPDGSIKYIYDRTRFFVDEAGNEEIVGAIGDITRHKLAEEAIRRSEAFLAEAQNLSHTGSFGWSISTGQLFWSEETFRIFQCEPSTKPTMELVLSRTHPEDYDLVQKWIDQASRDGNEFDVDHRLKLPDGSVKHVHVTARPASGGTDNLDYVGAITDVTEQRQAEAVVLERESELRQSLDFTPQLLCVFGSRRERLFINRHALDYLGITFEVWRSDRPVREIHPDDIERFQSQWDRAELDNASYFEIELRLRRFDGIYRWVQGRLNSFRDGNGQILRWYVACTDIDDRKRDEERLQRENLALREQIEQANLFDEIVGSSEPLHKVLVQVHKVAGSDSTVLILGETGTGKELIARAIHRRSKRASGTFIGVNCGAITPSLIASELFGHEKGAFTGATQRRVGHFEAASGGTIFLDEVGDLPPDVQIALLRVLQERVIQRVGGDKPIPVDVRVLAATHRDIEKLVSDGTLRQDLFYRLNVVPISMPALRERPSDIPVLADYFIARFGKRVGKEFRSINENVLEMLRSYDWPGNVRELQNVIERAVILCDTDNFVIDEGWLKRGPAEAPASRIALSRMLLAQEREAIELALTRSHGRVSGPLGAAAKLRIATSTLESKIKRLGIDKYRFR
jgi:formate hydrogenlyase transcriptional activator